MKQKKEISHLVAEKVLGWDKQTLPNFEGSPYTADYWVNALGEIERPVNFFSPSSNLEDAWRVVERLGYVHKQLEWDAKNKQWCFIIGNGLGERWSAFHKQASLAICLSALKTVNVHVEEVE